MFFEVLLQKSEYRVLAGTPVFPRLIDLLELIEAGKVLKLLLYLFIDANIAEEILEDLTGDLVDLLLVTIAMIPDLPGDLPCFIKIIKRSHQCDQDLRSGSVEIDLAGGVRSQHMTKTDRSRYLVDPAIEQFKSCSLKTIEGSGEQ